MFKNLLSFLFTWIEHDSWCLHLLFSWNCYWFKYFFHLCFLEWPRNVAKFSCCVFLQGSFHTKIRQRKINKIWRKRFVVFLSVELNPAKDFGKKNRLIFCCLKVNFMWLVILHSILLFLIWFSQQSVSSICKHTILYKLVRKFAKFFLKVVNKG